MCADENTMNPTSTFTFVEHTDDTDDSMRDTSQRQDRKVVVVL